MILSGWASLHHVGIAVLDLDAAVSWHVCVLGATVLHEEELPFDLVKEVALDLGGTMVQLVSPTSAQSPVARFLTKRGEGLHHVGYYVLDLEDAITRATAQGALPVSPWPRAGSANTKVAFLHPKQAFGTLIELVERPAQFIDEKFATSQ